MQRVIWIPNKTIGDSTGKKRGLLKTLENRRGHLKLLPESFLRNIIGKIEDRERQGKTCKRKFDIDSYQDLKVSPLSRDGWGFLN